MPTSTSLVYRQYQTIDNSGTGAGTQWLHALWHIYQWLFVDSNAIDTGRWRLLGSSPADWSVASNIVDNSWFAFEASNGRRSWQGKFQASNVAVLDESPSTSYTLVASLSPDGGWSGKGLANGGFAATSVPAGAHLRLGGTDLSSGSDGTLTMCGDRDTLLVAIATDGSVNYDAGCYLGRFDPIVDQITKPECLLTAWDGSGSPKGFDRTAVGGVFGAAPGGSYALDSGDASTTCKVYTPAWLNTARQPDAFSSQYQFRSLELAISDSPLGFLRHVVATGGLGSKSRMDYRRKLVLHSGDSSLGIALKHNGTAPS